MKYTVNKILTELDNTFILSTNPLDPNNRKYDYTFFLDLEHGYSFNAGSKIHLYADEENRAVIFETLVYQNRGDRFANELIYIGNCIIPVIETFDGKSTTSNMKIVTLVNSSELERITVKDSGKIDANARFISINGNIIPLDNSGEIQEYEDLLLYLYRMNPPITCATEYEIRTQLPLDIPKLMEIDEFHYISNYDSILPSKQELYMLISQIIVQKEPCLWNPTQIPNNDSNNWESGFL